MKVNRKRFERLADKLTKVSHGRYHINRSIGIDEVGTIYYTRWCIFDRLDDGPLYFSSELSTELFIPFYKHPLFDMEIGNNYIAGVIDVAAKKHAKRLGLIKPTKAA